MKNETMPVNAKKNLANLAFNKDEHNAELTNAYPWSP